MIDRIYFTLPPAYGPTLDSCSFLPWKQTVDGDGVLGEWKIANWGAFEIKISNYSGRIEVRGSLHKYWSGNHNGGAFPRYAVAQAVERLAAELKFNPVQGVLHNVEYGANVPMPTPAKELLCRMMLHSRKGGPAKVPGTSHNQHGIMREVVAQRYYLKAYDKEAQLDDSSGDTTGAEALRVELKVCTMEQLKQAGVRTLADLAHPAKLEAMGKILFAQWDSLLFAAPGELPTKLRTADRRLLEQAARVGYWDGLPVPRLRLQVKIYRKLYAQYVVDEALQAATQGIRSVWQQLLTQPEPMAAVATIAELPASQLNPLCKVLSLQQEREEAAPSQTAEGLLAMQCPPARLAADDDEATLTPARWPDLTNRYGSDDDHDETGARRWPDIQNLYPSSDPHDDSNDDEREPMPPAARCCLTCGAPIASHRKPETRYCGKKCRNAASNPGNNARRTLLKIESQPLLFPIREFVRVPEQYRAFVLAAA
jgi:hypothetical protein